MSQQFKYLTSDLAVASQLSVADVQAAKDAGFNTIINNRPDNEEPGQPRNEQISRAASELGLDFHYLPVISGQLLDSNVREFKKLLPQLRWPVLMFCRSGTRCTHLWALSQTGELPAEQICASASAAGYDLEALLPRIRQQQEQ